MVVQQPTGLKIPKQVCGFSIKMIHYTTGRLKLLTDEEKRMAKFPALKKRLDRIEQELGIKEKPLVLDEEVK